jgi:Sulfotransferase domain
MSLRFHYHSLRRDVSNFSLLRHRDYTGFLVSMHQSGTHWLKHMLATAIAARHGLPPPRFSHANDIIGGVHDHPVPQRGPLIVSSHSIPHLLLASALLRHWVRFPPYVVLVRDLRATLVANYEKWKSHYQCSFSEFLRGDMGGRRFNNDIWWCIRFCNAWGRIAGRFPAHTLLVRYESLQQDAYQELLRIDAFWKLGLGAEALALGVKESGKETMARKRDPATPHDVIVVRDDRRHFSEWYTGADREFVTTACGRLLRHSVGYDYSRWPDSSS